MATELRLAKQQLSDLAAIRDLDATSISTVVKAILEVAPRPMRPDRLLSIARSSLTSDAKAAEAIARQAVVLNGLMRQMDIDWSETHQGVGEALRQQGWDEKALQQWTMIEPQMQQVVEAPAVRFVASTLDLAYNYANLYRRGRILTDIRPIYSRVGDEIEGAVVSFTLRLRYDSANDDHDLSIALDDADVRQLLEQCQRALKKASVAKETMCSKFNVPTVVIGEQDDE